MKYISKKASQISFPLGGIGTGCIGLSGNGSLIDVEIKNRPNKNSTAEFTHFAVKAETEHEVLDARVLQGDYPKITSAARRDLYILAMVLDRTEVLWPVFLILKR